MHELFAQQVTYTFVNKTSRQKMQFKHMLSTKTFSENHACFEIGRHEDLFYAAYAKKKDIVARTVCQETPDNFVQQLQATQPVDLAANLLDHRYTGQNWDAKRHGLCRIRPKFSQRTRRKFMAGQPFSLKISHPVHGEAGMQLRFKNELSNFSQTLLASFATACIRRQYSTLGMSFDKLHDYLGIKNLPFYFSVDWEKTGWENWVLKFFLDFEK